MLNKATHARLSDESKRFFTLHCIYHLKQFLTCHHNYHIVILFVSFFQCHPKSSKNTGFQIHGKSSLSHIEVPTPQNTSFSELFDSLIYVPILLKNEAPLISEIYQIKIFNNKICLFDELNSSLHVLDDTGHLINAFFYDGEGPEKFLDMEDFNISGDTLLVYERTRQRIHYYDIFSKEYYGKKSTNLLFLEFIDFENLYFVYADDNEFPVGNPKRNRIQVYPRDFEKPIFSAYPFVPIKDDIDIPQVFFTLKDMLFFIDLQNDTVFSFKNNHFYSEYIVDFGVRKVPDQVKETIDRDFFARELFENKYRGYKHYLMADQHFLAFWFREGLDQRFFIHKKKTNTNHSVDRLLDDLDGGELPFPMTYDPEKQHFISVIEKEQIIKDQKLNSQNSNLKLVFQEEIDNYLVFYKLKHP